MDIFLTYHASCRGDPSGRVLEDQSVDARGTLTCSTYRCFELIEQFTHNHNDMQWLCHGSSMLSSQIIRHNRDREALSAIEGDINQWVTRSCAN